MARTKYKQQGRNKIEEICKEQNRSNRAHAK